MVNPARARATGEQGRGVDVRGVSGDRRASAALALALATLIVHGCGSDDAEPERKREPLDAFYSYGPILEPGQRAHRVALDVVRIPAQAGAETYMPPREMRVTEVFLICWPDRDWPADDIPQVTVHPLGQPEAQRAALEPGKARGDRVRYAPPQSDPIAADFAFVELGAPGPCEQVRFAVRGQMRTVLRDQPPDEKDDKGEKDDNDKDDKDDAKTPPGETTDKPDAPAGKKDG
ncbi:MAG: hypothetical protein JO021_23550 [Alphaproteobacteria bacterium]|nr:hypothetical protein [Alphaproteobacteria bacterium]